MLLFNPASWRFISKQTPVIEFFKTKITKKIAAGNSYLLIHNMFKNLWHFVYENDVFTKFYPLFYLVPVNIILQIY